MKWKSGNMDQISFKSINGCFESLKPRNSETKNQAIKKPKTKQPKAKKPRLFFIFK